MVNQSKLRIDYLYNYISKICYNIHYLTVNAGFSKLHFPIWAWKNAFCHLSLWETPSQYKPQHSTVQYGTIWLTVSMRDLQHWPAHRQIYSRHLFNRSALRLLWKGQLNRTTAPIDIRANDATFTTGPNTATQQPRLMGEGETEKERASGCRFGWGVWRGKCNPGNCYRKRLEPVLPGRLDLRSRRDAITERRERVQMEERKEKGGRKREGKRERKKNYLLFWVCRLLLTLSSFSCTIPTLLQPAQIAATVAAQGSL